jgi:hypothetical protein
VPILHIPLPGVTPLHIPAHATTYSEDIVAILQASTVIVPPRRGFHAPSRSSRDILPAWDLVGSETSVHGRMARGDHGLPEVSPGSAIPDPFKPCGRLLPL